MKAETGDYIEVDGLQTFYIKRGVGHPLLLIHGGSPGTCSEANWKQNIEAFAASGFTVYAFDQPGFGNTDNPVDYSLEYRVSHAKSFINTLRIDAFHVIGNSQGAYIAARLALEDQRAGGLVLVASATLAPKGSDESEAMAKEHSEELGKYTPSVDNVRAMTLKTLFNRDLVSEELVHQRYEMSKGKNFQAHLKRKEAPRPRPIEHELPKLRNRTLILWGKNDRGASAEKGVLLFKMIPGAELHLFDRCAHWVQWDQYARFNRIVIDFLRPEIRCWHFGNLLLR